MQNRETALKKMHKRNKNKSLNILIWARKAPRIDKNHKICYKEISDRHKKFFKTEKGMRKNLGHCSTRI